VLRSYLAGKTPKRLDADALLNYALRTLGGRAQASGELREKLLRRASRREDADEVIRKLKEAGYLDDRSFAEGYAAARLENEGHGRARVLRDLRQHRVAPNLAEQAVERTFSGKDELELIDQFLKRKFRGKDLALWLGDEKNLAAAYRRLRYAGFSGSNSIRVLKRYADRAEELDELGEIPENEI